ncbi:MAG: ATP-binding protein [Candidatus Eisenbacteria bacterium]|nr:ATP-binding protein [Candidatus Eisenbacteria bacterium]
MRYVRRELERRVLAAARDFPAVVLTGPRRAGKTFLLRHLLPDAGYYLFEDPDLVARFRSDPQGFLDDVRLPAILDEIQNVPEVFNFVRARIDRAPRRMGRWFLTGSREAGLMRNVSESMAGRAAVLHLFPMSVREHPKVGILRGGYPEVLARPRAASLWFSSYLQTYLERDVRSIAAVQDLAAFRRFLALLAARHGRILNKTDLAAPLGMSIPGITAWLRILEATQQIVLVPPFFENLGKRLVKSPKLYLADSGLVCHLLGIDTEAELRKSPLLGEVFEGFLAAEIVKAQVNAGRRPEIYTFRDQQGLEVDFLVPMKGGRFALIEAKASRTAVPSMAAPMLRLAEAWKARRGARSRIDLFVVHESPRACAPSRAIAPGVRALPWPIFLKEMKLD